MPGRGACYAYGNTLGYPGHSLCSCVQYNQRLRPYGASRRICLRMSYIRRWPGFPASGKQCDITSMHWRSDGGSTNWIAPSIFALRTSSPSWFTVNSQLCCPNWVTAVRQRVFCYWACIILTVVGGSLSGLSLDGLVFGTLRAQFLFCATVCFETGGLSKLSIAYSVKCSSTGLSSLLKVFDRNNASAA